MKNDRKTTATFTATFQGKSASGRAIKLTDCRQGKISLFDEMYIPISQLESFVFTNKKKMRVSITIEEWLFDAKMEEYIQEQAKSTKIFNTLDQATFLIDNPSSKNQTKKKIDRLVDELAENPNK